MSPESAPDARGADWHAACVYADGKLYTSCPDSGRRLPRASPQQGMQALSPECQVAGVCHPRKQLQGVETPEKPAVYLRHM